MDLLTLSIGIGIGLLVGGLGGYIAFMRNYALLEKQHQRISSEKEHLQKSLNEKEAALTRAQREMRESQQSLQSAQQNMTRLESDFQHLHQRYNSREKEIVRMEKQFEQMATHVLEKNAQKMQHSSQQQLRLLLDPLKERLQAFEQKVESTYQQEARERLLLKKEIEDLMQLNLQMGEDARNLTKALKGENKTQGNWGELVLIRVLEQSGLRKGEEYVVQAEQMMLQNEEGKRLRPDVIVRLPEDKHIVVDSKVSLTAYERFVSSEDIGEAEVYKKQHLQSVITHIDQLSAKHYQSLSNLRSPDFVLLFMPLEPAFGLAIQAKSDIFQYAWEKKIVLVSPTTLLATLKTIASIWKLENQSKYAEEIALQGGRLYDKFVGFVEDLEKVGNYLEKTQQAYQSANKKLHEGRGNLVSKAEQLREMGAKSKKKLK